MIEKVGCGWHKNINTHFTRRSYNYISKYVKFACQKMVFRAWKSARFTRSINEIRINASLINKHNIDFAVVATY